MLSFKNKKTNSIWGFRDIKNGVVEMIDGNYRIEVYPVNFSLLEVTEKLNKISVFQTVIRQFKEADSLKVLVQTRKLFLNDYVELMKRTFNIKGDRLIEFKNYEDFVRSYAEQKDLVTKRFFIIIETAQIHDSFGSVKQELDEKALRILHEFSGANISGNILTTDGCVEVLMNSIDEDKYLQNKSTYRNFGKDNESVEIERNVLRVIQPDLIHEDVRKDYLIIDNKYLVRSFYVGELPSRASIDWFELLINLDYPSDLMFSFKIKDYYKRINAVKNKRNDIEASIMERESKGISGNVNDELVLEDLRETEEQLHRGTNVPVDMKVSITLRARNEKDLKLFSERLISNSRGRGFILRNYVEEQIEGLKDTLFVCNSKPIVKPYRDLNSEVVSYSFPFSQSIISSETGILYGINPEKKMVFIDRQNLSSYNKSIIAFTGAGKSYYLTTDIYRSYLIGYQQFIIDPEGEYEPLVNELGGKYIKSSNTSKDFLNPFFIPFYDEAREFFALNVGYALSLIKYLVGKLEYSEVQLTLLREVVQAVYTTAYKENRQILLKDFIEAIRKEQPEKLSGFFQVLSQYLNHDNPMYYLFNNYQNVDYSKDSIVAFYLGKSENPSLLASIIIQQYWNNLLNPENRQKFKILVVDEARSLLNFPVLVSQLRDISLRGRKYNSGLTTVVQEISHYYDTGADDLIDQSAVTFVMRQKPGDPLNRVCEKLNLNREEKRYLESLATGHGLLMIDSIKESSQGSDSVKMHRNVKIQLEVVASKIEDQLHFKGKKIVSDVKL